MEEKQLEQINNLSKDELVEHINSYFNKQAKYSFVIAILWGIIAILSLFPGPYTSEYGILLPCLWFLLIVIYSFRFLEYRKLSKEDSAKGLLTRYDKYKKRDLSLIPICIILLCIPIYKIFAEKHFALNAVDWVSCIIIGLCILYLVWYFFSSKLRTKMEKSRSGNINQWVERLRELVEQEEGKSEEELTEFVSSHYAARIPFYEQARIMVKSEDFDLEALLSMLAPFL